MMVAAHSSDLAAAAALGLRIGHIARPNEKGTGRGESTPTITVNIAVQSLEALAEKLGA
jgi:2-haloacid dehalogenase